MKRNSYETYIMDVLKGIHPDLEFSKKGVETMDLIVKNLFNRIAEHAGKLANQNQEKTLTVKELEIAVRSIIGGDLAENAISKGENALLNEFSDNLKND